MDRMLEAMKNRRITMVALGDSNTEVNWWTHGSLNWVGLLECNLYEQFRQGKMLINSGIGGSSVPHSLERLDRDVTLFKPDVVIVSLGINDAAKCDPDGFGVQYRILLERILKTGARVITRTPQPLINMSNGTEIREMTFGDHQIITYMVEEYAEKIVRISAELDCPCIDHYSSWKRSISSKYRGEMVMLMAQTMHPNAMGHRRFYHEMAPIFGLSPYKQCDFEHILLMEDRL